MTKLLGGQPLRGVDRGALLRTLREAADAGAPGAVNGPGDRVSIGRRRAMGVGELARPTLGSGAER